MSAVENKFYVVAAQPKECDQSRRSASFGEGDGSRWIEHHFKGYEDEVIPGNRFYYAKEWAVARTKEESEERAKDIREFLRSFHGERA